VRIIRDADAPAKPSLWRRLAARLHGLVGRITGAARARTRIDASPA
jgi:hypothetical protein